MKTRSTWAAAAAALCLAGSAQAALLHFGNGSVLDTETRLVWLEDWGLRSFQGWATQTSWAENLTFAGSNDWHLPTIEQYATLYAWLQLDGLTLSADFANVHPSAYWSSTDDPMSPTGAFWFFADTGLQVSASKDFGGYATAVRIYSPIPEPSSFALTALGLLAAGLARHRQSRRGAATHASTTACTSATRPKSARRWASRSARSPSRGSCSDPSSCVIA